MLKWLWAGALHSAFYFKPGTCPLGKWALNLQLCCNHSSKAKRWLIKNLWHWLELIGMNTFATLTNWTTDPDFWSPDTRSLFLWQVCTSINKIHFFVLVWLLWWVASYYLLLLAGWAYQSLHKCISRTWSLRLLNMCSLDRAQPILLSKDEAQKFETVEWAQHNYTSRLTCFGAHAWAFWHIGQFKVFCGDTSISCFRLQPFCRRKI